MIIKKTHGVLNTEVVDYAKAMLKRFKNTEFCAKIISENFNTTKKDRQNVNKQARQIRYFISQAEEYFVASQAVSLITKPTLLYYSIMCLAVVEFLFKNNGDYSLDKVRERNSHHGLRFIVNSDHSSKISSKDSIKALQLECKPASRENGERYGTFEIWHNSARHAPLISRFVNHMQSGRTSTIRVSATNPDKRIGLFPASGINLQESCSYIPGMLPTLSELGVASNVIRAKSDFDYHSTDSSWKHDIIIHPGNKEKIETLLHEFTCSPSAVEMLDYISFDNGGLIRVKSLPDFLNGDYKMNFPSCSCPLFPDVYFWSDRYFLNEFGFLYVSLYILGNYARYFADKWVHDVESYTDLAFLASNLTDIAERRMFLLTLSELTGEYLTPLREMPG